MGLILFLSSRSSLPTSLPGHPSSLEWLMEYRDEVGHLGEYAVLALLAYTSLRLSLSRRRAFILALAFCGAFSLADEAFQGLVPNRTPQATDVLLDGVGAAASLVLVAALGPRLRRYLRRPAWL